MLSVAPDAHRFPPSQNIRVRSWFPTLLVMYVTDRDCRLAHNALTLTLANRLLRGWTPWPDARLSVQISNGRGPLEGLPSCLLRPLLRLPLGLPISFWQCWMRRPCHSWSRTSGILPLSNTTFCRTPTRPSNTSISP